MQNQLMLQEQLVKQRNEFNHIFCSFRDGLVTYGTDMKLHFINPAMLRMLALPTDENYEGRQAGTYLRILCNGEDILHKLITWVREEKTPRPIPEKSFVQEIERHSHPVPQHLGRRTPTPVAAHDHGRQRHLQLAV